MENGSKIIVCYNSYRDAIYGPLSTYSNFPVTIDDVEYATAEHAIQVLRALLVAKTELAEKLMFKKTAHSCNRLGEAAYESYDAIEKLIWEENKLDILYTVLRQRIEQNEGVRDCLIKSVGTTLYCFDPRKNSINDMKINLIGTIQTCLRDELLLKK